MLNLFLNPYTMVAGAALVSSPIIIHLINRLRYRRVKWAAMEFLLKSQKKNRRRLIIEQLILLLLRIMLVLLVGLLLARFLWDALAFTRPQNTLHVVVLDDTPSMGDAWRADGVAKNTFDVAKSAVVDEIARGAAQARTPQALYLVRLSALDAPFPVERLSDTSVDDLQNHLADLKPSALHIDLIDGIRRAREIFEQNPTARHVLHVVSDFRARDWTGGPAESLQQEISALTQVKGQAGAAVHLLDVADPPRSPTQRAALDHGNTGILDIQPETRVAAKLMPVDFTVTLANYTPAERKNVRVVIKVNGQPREEASNTVVSVPPGITQKSFTVPFFDQVGFSQVSANLEAEEAGLAIDNTRYAVVEVREKVPLLFIEGDPAGSREKPEAGDSFYLRKLFLDAARGFDVVQRGVQELEQPNLDQYPAIYLFNVARLSDKARANLEAYVRNGGGVGFFLGEAVNVDFYNQQLYADGRGIFPVPLMRPTEPLNEQQKFDRVFDAAMPPKLFPRGDHPILNRIYRDDKTHESNTYLKFLLIDRYFPVNRVRWNPAPGTADELLTLPNYRSFDDYKEEAQRLLNQIPTDEEKAGPYAKLLKEHYRRVKEVLANGKQLYQLANAIEAMLNDTADPKDPAKPDLRAFWQQPARAELVGGLQRLAESVRYGDPLLVARKYGKGAVLAYMTTAGSAWNDFPNGPARPYWVMLMLEVQKYLAGVGSDVNRLVGSPLEITLDAARFTSRMRRFYVPEPGGDAGADKPAKGDQDLREQVGNVQGQRVTFSFTEARRPGVYRFEFTPQAAAGDKATGRMESQAVAFNVDTVAEGDLRRASRDDIESAAPGALLHSPGSGLADLLKEKKSDLSESPWLYLFILLVLVAEQAMAVRLSYHLSGNEAAPAINLGTRTVS
jgi:hypothetical protein